MDFYNVMTIDKKDGQLRLRPDWKVGKTTDLMTRGGQFYAVWDEERQLWSTDILDVQRLVDEDLFRHKQKLEARDQLPYRVDTLESNGTKLWAEFNNYIRNSGNNSHPLDERLVFANTQVKKSDYASKRLDYSLYEGDHSAWDALVGTLYNEEERAKIEWAIGAVVSGDSKSIQKFMVFYGPPGSGKSTILNIVERLFSGYTSVFDARELAGNNNAFATSAFKGNPLVAIQHDGDLSRIYDNTKLNSIVAHETMPMNEKYQKVVEMRVNAFLFMGTNMPVKITDAKAGIIRRLIDIVPTGQTLEHDLYHDLMAKVELQLGAIAHHCMKRYKAMGKNYYSSYRPTEMMLQTDVFYNYVEAYSDMFERDDGVSLHQAWQLYKTFCTETGIDKMLAQYKFREELKNYFYSYEPRGSNTGRAYFRGFKGIEPIPPTTSETPVKPEGEYEILLGDHRSIFDEVYGSQPAQLPNSLGHPKLKWANAKTTLADIDTKELHYVKVPTNLITIDFDLKNEAGEKDLALNLAEAAKWPPTYAETSKSGQGVHLHYTYGGDVSELAQDFAPGIEVLTLPGDAALRRKLSACNTVQIMPLSEGSLPKKEKTLIGPKSIQSEKGLREMIERNLRKEIHPSTKSSIDFIHKILEDVYASGVAYDVEDLRRMILTFALTSSNNSEYCVKLVQDMKFTSEVDRPVVTDDAPDEPVVFFDIEVYPNLFVVCYKIHKVDGVVAMVNPSAADIEPLLSMKLVGFNNRRYDNHILMAAYMGDNNAQLYARSQRLITSGSNDRSGYIGSAYDLSYADIYDFSSLKQGLKKFEIMLGILHQELDLPWDQPVDEKDWDRVVAYCKNDVVATEATFDNRAQDFVARQILASLSGLTPNHTTQQHTAKLIFGDDKNARNAFEYVDLRGMFPGYEFDNGTSTYHGEVVGEGGYVYAEPGVYENVIEFDVSSMHPTSIVQMNAFGPYTKRFDDLLQARLAIKARDYDKVATLLDGKLKEFVTGDDQEAQELSYALKIVINIVYGLTSARFENAFKDTRNKDNFVAKRGALFMIDLKRDMQERGYQVVHIKTDSIKIANVDSSNVDAVTALIMDFGHKYGYEFEVDNVYERFCLVNDAVFVAHDGDRWKAVGAQFQHPYVYKKLFSKEELEFLDYCETRSVLKGTMYLDFDDAPPLIREIDGTPVKIADIDKMKHVGRTGSFMPVMNGGGNLWRVQEKIGYAVVGTKGHRWITRDMAKFRESEQDLIVDQAYFDNLVEKALKSINDQAEKSGKSVEWFLV